MKEIEIGDSIVMINPHPALGLGCVNVGDIGVIRNIYPDESTSYKYMIDFPNHKHWKGYRDDIKILDIVDILLTSLNKLEERWKTNSDQEMKLN